MISAIILLASSFTHLSIAGPIKDTTFAAQTTSVTNLDCLICPYIQYRIDTATDDIQEIIDAVCPLYSDPLLATQCQKVFSDITADYESFCMHIGSNAVCEESSEQGYDVIHETLTQQGLLSTSVSERVTVTDGHFSIVEDFEAVDGLSMSWLFEPLVEPHQLENIDDFQDDEESELLFVEEEDYYEYYDFDDSYLFVAVAVGFIVFFIVGIVRSCQLIFATDDEELPAYTQVVSEKQMLLVNDQLKQQESEA